MQDLIIPNLSQKHPFRQWQIMRIPNTDWDIMGYSRSGDKTSFFVPQASIAIDAGLVEGNQAAMVFLTHTHSDHSYDLEYMASKDGVQICLPTASAKSAEEYIVARRRLNHAGEYNPALRGEMTITGVQKDDIIHWGEYGKYQTHVFECVHSIACVGFGFSEKRKRLKPEYETEKQAYLQAGKAKEFGAWIGQKRKEEVVEETYYQPLWAHLGDTTTEVFVRNPTILQYPTVFVECTFILPEHLTHAEERKHSHWDLLKPIVLANPQTLFVLIHFSLRYSDAEILAFFTRELEGIENVRLWISPDSFLPAQHQKR